MKNRRSPKTCQRGTGQIVGSVNCCGNIQDPRILEVTTDDGCVTKIFKAATIVCHTNQDNCKVPKDRRRSGHIFEGVIITGLVAECDSSAKNKTFCIQSSTPSQLCEEILQAIISNQYGVIFEGSII